MDTKPIDPGLLGTAERRLRRLSPERLRVADDFLAYLEEREESELLEGMRLWRKEKLFI